MTDLARRPSDTGPVVTLSLPSIYQTHLPELISAFEVLKAPGVTIASTTWQVVERPDLASGNGEAEALADDDGGP